MVVKVGDCERVQSSWFAARAAALDGNEWIDEGLRWIDGPDGFNLMFPPRLPVRAVARGVDRARDLGRGVVGAWLGIDVDSTALAACGFERGWSPWWMSASLHDVPADNDPRITLSHDASGDALVRPSDAQLLARAGALPPQAWHAAARTESGQLAGQAWSYLSDDLCGVFDMEVRAPFQRRGLGTGLLAAVCGAARRAGGTAAMLNATPEGKALYSTCGFAHIGEGITWWNHLEKGEN